MKMKKRIVVLLMALVLAVGLIGCKDTLKSIVHKASGTSDEVQEEDTTRWADQTSDPLIIQGIADSSAKFATATADGCGVQRHLEPPDQLLYRALRHAEHYGLRHG